MIRELTQEEFKRMHELEVELLVEFDRVCRKHNINYVIAFGTLLGAVRHKGFIPWDDDADLCMLREDYEKFKDVASEMDPEICYFQDNTTDKDYRWGYGKLRRTGTEYVRAGQEHLKCKTGVFVDIFVQDDIPMSTLGQWIQDKYCYCLRKITWSEVGKKQCSGIKKQWFSLLSLIPITWVFKGLEFITKKSNNTTPNRVTCLLFPSVGQLYFKAPLKERFGVPKKWYLERAEYDFEGHKLYGSKDYDEVLSFIYHDYMKLPPMEKREQHSPVSYIKLV